MSNSEFNSTKADWRRSLGTHQVPRRFSCRRHNLGLVGLAHLGNGRVAVHHVVVAVAADVIGVVVTAVAVVKVVNGGSCHVGRRR